MKWCTHCRKSDHSDAECWSTRVVHRDPLHSLAGHSVRMFAAPGEPSALLEAMRLAAILPPQPLCEDPEFIW